MSAAAAVAEAASEVLATAPPAMAAAVSILDPVRPANCATDLENTARDAAERSCPVTLIRSGPELPRKNFCTSLTSAPGCGWCVGEAKSGHQTADEAHARQHPAERCRIIEL